MIGNESKWTKPNTRESEREENTWIRIISETWNIATSDVYAISWVRWCNISIWSGMNKHKHKHKHIIINWFDGIQWFHISYFRISQTSIHCNFPFSFGPNHDILDLFTALTKWRTVFNITASKFGKLFYITIVFFFLLRFVSCSPGNIKMLCLLKSSHFEAKQIGEMECSFTIARRFYEWWHFWQQKESSLSLLIKYRATFSSRFFFLSLFCCVRCECVRQ